MNKKLAQHNSNINMKSLDMLCREYDDTNMQLPGLEADPHLLISKVRKHYLEYVIQLLSVNYENYQKLLGKNIYLPSAIWRCAKVIEINAAQACMVVDLYRQNIVTVIKELKLDTKKGKLNKKLFECLQTPPKNEKKIQVTEDKPKNCNCQCTCNELANIKKRRKLASKADFINRKSNTIKHPIFYDKTDNLENTVQNESVHEMLYKIPVLVNSNINNAEQMKTSQSHPNAYSNSNNLTSMPRMSIESQDSEDQVMLQLEQLFRADSNELEDDLFESTLCESIDSNNWDTQENIKLLEGVLESNNVQQNSLVDEQAAKIKSLDERLAMLESSGALHTSVTKENTDNQESKVETPKQQKQPQKWQCELYFQKLRLFEKIDEIRESNRKKHSRIRHKFIELFGDDSDDEQEVMSPLDETPEFVQSCKERIAPWIVKLLTPHYVKGRILGKSLFKSLAKHLIRLIYQCSKYPSEYEVHSFVNDFLRSHKMIRCEADFREFRIENI